MKLFIKGLLPFSWLSKPCDCLCVMFSFFVLLYGLCISYVTKFANRHRITMTSQIVGQANCRVFKIHVTKERKTFTNIYLYKM